MIRLKNFSFTYEGEDKRALENINIHIKKGECIVIGGSSGHGKTTLTRVLNGLAPYYFEGKLEGDYDFLGEKNLTLERLSREVASVFQDPRSQFFSLDVLSELVFTLENEGLSKEEMDNRIDETKKIIDIENLLDKKIFDLSSGEKQKIAIASVLCQKPKVIILDEPSANLDYKGTLELGESLLKLKKEGFTIIISEHRFFYLKDIIDKFYLMKNGKIEKSFLREEFLALGKITNDFGLRSIKPFEKIYEKKRIRVGSRGVEVKNLSFKYKKGKEVFYNISLNFNNGEIIGLLGKNGSGKSTFVKVLAGLLKEKKGDIYIKGEKTKWKSRREKFSLVLQDADYQLFSESVEKEFHLGKNEVSQEEVDKILEKFSLLSEKYKHPISLSGGQKQRLTIALSILKGSEIVILDEPTSGLCYKNMKKIVRFCKLLKRLGKIVIFITHDYEFVQYTADRCIYMEAGRVEEDFYLLPPNQNRLKELFGGR